MSKTRSKGSGSIFRRTDKGPWLASWVGHDGRRRERSTRTTDKATARRILDKLVADAALRRDGVIDASKDRVLVEGRRPLTEHAADYLRHCGHAGQDAKHLKEKRRHLDRLTAAMPGARLADLTADALVRHLATVKEDHRSARTINARRAAAVSLFSWCVKQGRAETNPLLVVPTLDERKDRRKVRRALTDDELARLLQVARERGREAWYLLPLMAGLRRGDLRRLHWSDVNFTDGTLTIRGGKSGRTDILPMHPQLADALRRHFENCPGVPSTPVFSTWPTDHTRRRDFERADIALLDDAGRVADLHALRTTLGTRLARAGVVPQVAQRIMRHADYKTTLAHYTVLGLHDAAQAVGALATIGTPGENSNAATGTHDAHGGQGNEPEHPPLYPPRYSPRLARADGHDAAPACADADTYDDRVLTFKPPPDVDLDTGVRPVAPRVMNGAQGTRTPNFQLAKLATPSGNADPTGTYNGSNPPPRDSPRDSHGHDDLDRLVAMWASLPDGVRAAVLAQANGSTVEGVTRG